MHGGFETATPSPSVEVPPRRRWFPLVRQLGRASDELPIGTLLFYGPDNRHASKVVASVFFERHGEPLLRKWFWDGELDVRTDPRIGREVTRFFDEHGVRRIATTPGLAGCPHEEGIDYPDGEACPQCPFWADRDRWEEASRPPSPPGHLAS